MKTAEEELLQEQERGKKKKKNKGSFSKLASCLADDTYVVMLAAAKLPRTLEAGFFFEEMEEEAGNSEGGVIGECISTAVCLRARANAGGMAAAAFAAAFSKNIHDRVGTL